jgi:glutathione S-transferase
MMTPTLSAFRWVPPFAQGYVRDLRVRWALEEAGLPYKVELIDQEIQRSPEYQQWQPFGQVPAYRDDQVEIFESGAIVLHLADHSEALAPSDPAGRARVTTWVLAALNSVEPFAQDLAMLHAFYADEDWAKARRPQLEELVRKRLASLSAVLDGRDWLEHRFTAGDLMMATVLRNLQDTGELDRVPVVSSYLQRCLARPAFERALNAQLKVFQGAAPRG